MEDRATPISLIEPIASCAAPDCASSDRTVDHAANVPIDLSAIGEDAIDLNETTEPVVLREPRQVHSPILSSRYVI